MGVEDEEEENREVGSFGAKPFACQIDGGKHVGHAATGEREELD